MQVFTFAGLLLADVQYIGYEKPVLLCLRQDQQRWLVELFMYGSDKLIVHRNQFF